MSKKQEEDNRPTGVSRRGFMTSLGTGAFAATVGTVGGSSLPEAQTLIESDRMSPVDLRVNGRKYSVLVEPRWSLLHVLRDQLGLTGTKQGCERGECGSCTVLIDDRPRYACLTLAIEAVGHNVVTVEGLMHGEDLGAVQQAFVEKDAFQCGFCTPGQIVAVEGLLRAHPDPSLDQIRKAVSGNLCRCGAYKHIFTAAERAAVLKRSEGRSS